MFCMDWFGLAMLAVMSASIGMLAGFLISKYDISKLEQK